MADPQAGFSEEMFTHFPTQLMRRRYGELPALNQPLRKLLLDMEKNARNKLVGTSNIGGYHSDTKLLNVQNSAIAQLRGMITEAIVAFVKPLLETQCARPPEDIGLKFWGWGIVMRAGDMNQQHMHPDANISGVYYVAVPEQLRKVTPGQPYGCITFVDPRPTANAMRLPNQIQAHPINPMPGDLILFPSYYEHAVMPFKGPGERICIAFNARID
jgi:uncharacterized protein (TIGR02466 family)